MADGPACTSDGATKCKSCDAGHHGDACEAEIGYLLAALAGSCYECFLWAVMENVRSQMLLFVDDGPFCFVVFGVWSCVPPGLTHWRREDISLCTVFVCEKDIEHLSISDFQM